MIVQPVVEPMDRFTALAWHDEGEAPVVPAGREEGAGDQGAEDVAEAGVGVPQTHDEAAPALAEPVGHDGHHPGPARGLEHPQDHLHTATRVKRGVIVCEADLYILMLFFS